MSRLRRMIAGYTNKKQAKIKFVFYAYSWIARPNVTLHNSKLPKYVAVSK